MERNNYIEIILDELIELKKYESNIIEQMNNSIYISDNDYINEELNIVIHEIQLLQNILEKLREKKEGN